MGKRTKNASDAKAEMTDLPIDTAVGDCPLKRKGDIKIIVKWQHDYSVVSGVPVSLTGKADKSGSTGGDGSVTFKKCDPGSYSYTADLSALDMKFPAQVTMTDNESVVRDKLNTVTLYIVELSAVSIEVIEKEGDAEIGPVPDADVLSISGGGQKVENSGTARIEKVPAGIAAITVMLKAPHWKLARNQNLEVDLKPGEETKLKVFAVRQSFIAIKVRDVGADKDVTDARAEMKLPSGDLTHRTMEKAEIRATFDKSAATTDIKKIQTGPRDQDSTLYEFVELTSG
ncbi:MAG: hypothetical protein ACJA1L_001152 [Paracoccaceae bacterium]|jgi:hypothetical protein